MLDKEFLEDYGQREREVYDRLLKDAINGKFMVGKDRFPPDERFNKIKRPRAQIAPPFKTVWAQIPFCGSIILNLAPLPKNLFEEWYFKISEMDKVLDFIKETGRLQISLGKPPECYKDADYLEPILKELHPPLVQSLDASFYGTDEEIAKAQAEFDALASVKYTKFTFEQAAAVDSSVFQTQYDLDLGTYLALKLGKYDIVETIESLLIDDPLQATLMLSLCDKFITHPFMNLTFDVFNYRFDELQKAQVLPAKYQVQSPSFPNEIGQFLLEKLTYAPMGLDACKELIYNYDRYDLQKLLYALNEGILNADPDVVGENSEALSEILENIWCDKTIPHRIRNLKIGLPLTMAAIGGVAGSIAAGSIGGMAGLLSGLGYNLIDRSIDLEADILSEKIAKLRRASYQLNIFDFKKDYKIQA